MTFDLESEVRKAAEQYQSDVRRATERYLVAVRAAMHLKEPESFHHVDERAKQFCPDAPDMQMSSTPRVRIPERPLQPPHK